MHSSMQRRIVNRFKIHIWGDSVVMTVSLFWSRGSPLFFPKHCCVLKENSQLTGAYGQDRVFLQTGPSHVTLGSQKNVPTSPNSLGQYYPAKVSYSTSVDPFYTSATLEEVTFPKAQMSQTRWWMCLLAWTWQRGEAGNAQKTEGKGLVKSRIL